MAITPATLQDVIRFADCEFVSGLALRGTGAYVYAAGTLSWSVTVPRGNLEYVATGTNRHVSGTWKDAPVDITR
jgi:hypothetical protein